MERLSRALALACLIAVTPLAAFAAGEGVETRLDARKVERAADGKERLVPAESARPGDAIQYTATYRNSSAQPVRNLEATLPIPGNTEFVADSATPPLVRASVDGRDFAPLPLKRRVVRNGVATEEPVPLREYRYLRWYPGELAAGQSVAFSARVKVIEDANPREPDSRGSAR